MALEIRQVDRREAPRMRALFRAAFAPIAQDLGYRPSPMDRPFARAFDVQGVIAAAIDGRSIGYAVVTPTETGLYVEAIAVAPGYQGRGVGRRLLLAIEELASELCLPAVTLDTDPALAKQRRFYERAGYRRVRRFRPSETRASVRYAKPVETALKRLLRSDAPARRL